MDELIFHWFNQINGVNGAFSGFQGMIGKLHFRIAPFMMAVWFLWFLYQSPDERTATRIRLLASVLITVPVIGITRYLANTLPFNVRPLHSDDLGAIVREGQSEIHLDGWSSMPSDHASISMALAICLLLIHRRVGVVMILWSIFVVSIPRIIAALHWPSDILVGWIIGLVVALILFKPFEVLVEKSRIVPFFEQREAIGYPLLFLLTFEAATLFSLSRYLILGITG